MPKLYWLIYETPQGRCHVEADTADAFENMVSAKLTRILGPQKRLEGLSLDNAAKETLRIYRAKFNYCRIHQSKTSLAKAGVELDVIKCYLRDMTIMQTVEWIQKNRAIKISKSAVGRYRVTLLNKLRIYPIMVHNI